MHWLAVLACGVWLGASGCNRNNCLKGIRAEDICTLDSECCSGDCTLGSCKPVCSWLYAGCDESVPCCSGYLCRSTGVCCADEGTTCETDTDCCAQHCSNGHCSTAENQTLCSQNGDCDHNASCALDGGFEACTCNQGWVGNGNVCVDDNDAAADIPGPNPCGAATPSPELDEKDKMAIVPAGPFWQGCNLAVDPWCVPVEMPGRCVTLSAYEIDLTEVSQGDYDKCVAAEHCSRPASCGKPFNYSPIFTPDLPVACVSWEQAQQYCGWVANGTKRLPTEAEWEKAARGVDGRLYPWGNENPDSQANPCNWAVYDLCPSSEKNVGTTPYDVSPYGVRDLAGNVWEWVSDWYDPQYYQTAPTTDPQGPAQNPTIIMSNYGPFHVYRGGGITDQTTFLRASNRFGGPPGVYPNVGLRCARSMN